MLGAGGLIAVLGLVDDVVSLPAWPKMIIQVVAAAIAALAAKGHITVLNVPPAGRLLIPISIGVLVTVLWGVGVTNEFNFMDGINGIISVESILSAAAYCVLFLGVNDPTGAMIALAILGATAGFMPWNFPSGSIFMGDAGSGTLGFLFAFLAVRLSAGGASAVAALLPLSPFLFDASLTILIRVGRGERFFSTPHRSHLYQRLVAIGWGHAAVTSLWAALAIVCCAIAVYYDGMPAPWQCAALGAAVGTHVALACFVLWTHSRWLAATERASSFRG